MKSSKYVVAAFFLWGLAICLQVAALGYRVYHKAQPAPPGRIEAKEAVEGAELDVRRAGSIDATRYVIAEGKLSVAPHWYLYVRRGDDVACYEVPQASYEAAKVGDQASPLFDDFGFRRVERTPLRALPADDDSVPPRSTWPDCMYRFEKGGR